ncbi:MAG: toxin [Labilithrix sp.]|nr:toxin [Labilithrix sp.]
MRGWIVPALLAGGIVACGAFSGDEGPSSSPPGAEPSDGGADVGLVTGEPAADGVTLAAVPDTLMIIQGSSAKLAVTITRGKQQRGPVVLRVTGLRDGITAAEVTITGDTGELEITAPAAAAQGAAVGVIEAVAKTSSGADMKATTMVNVLVRGEPGSLDRTFATDGVAADLFGLFSSVMVDDVVLGPDESVYVVAHNDTFGLVAHLGKDGKPDTTYGDGGVALVLNAPTRAVVQPDGKLVVVGAYAGKGWIGRLTANGQPDATFAGSVSAGMNAPGTAGLNGTNVALTGVVLRADGHILAPFSNDDGGSYRKAGILHFQPDGTFATGFGLGGSARFVIAYPFAILLRTSGPSKGTVTTLSSGSGALPTGGVNFDQRSSDTATSDPLVVPNPKNLGGLDFFGGQDTQGLVELSDGSVVTPTSDQSRFSLMKLDPTGNRATSFGTGGVAGPYPGSRPNGIALQKDGSFIVSAANALYRMDAAGVADAAFGPSHDGQVPAASTDSYRRVVLQKSGRIIAGVIHIGPPYSTRVAAFWP